MKHVPPVNITEDIKMSPVIGKLFSATRAQQNAQQLTGCGNCYKYLCKYVGKMDEQNRVVVSVDVEGKIKIETTFLHNTKVTESKINEEKNHEKDRNKRHPHGRAISQNKMLHVIFGYPEVVTDHEHEQIPTLPLELRPGVDTNIKKKIIIITILLMVHSLDWK